jgi:predicted PurR-regulated permease PerM
MNARQTGNEEEPELGNMGLGAEPLAEDEKPAITDLTTFFRTTQTAMPVALLGLFLIALLWFLHSDAQGFIIPIVFAVILNFLLKPLVNFINRFRVPHALAAALTLGLFLGTTFFICSKLTQPLVDWTNKGPENMKELQTKLYKVFRFQSQISKAAENLGNISDDPGNVKPAAEEGDTSPLPMPTKPKAQEIVAPPASAAPKVTVNAAPPLSDKIFSYLKSLIGGLVEMVVLLYFLLAAGDLFMQKLVKVLPTFKDKKKAVEITHELQRNISMFLFTITVINTCFGCLIGLAMWCIGMPNPVLWGFVAALLNFIPYFGPLSGVMILLVSGQVAFDSVGLGLVPAAIYLVMHALESNLLTPMILGHRLTLNPVVIFVSLIFWTWLWGIPGALLAIPMLMMIKILCDHFKPLASIGEFLDG